jgi:hypothetical protein
MDSKKTHRLGLRDVGKGGEVLYFRCGDKRVELAPMQAAQAVGVTGLIPE